MHQIIESRMDKGIDKHLFGKYKRYQSLPWNRSRGSPQDHLLRAPKILNRPLVIGLGMHDLITWIHAKHYMQCTALWTKVTAKCLNVKYCHEIQAFMSHTSIKSAPHTLLKIRLLYWHLWLHEESQIFIAQKVLYSGKKLFRLLKG